MMASELLVIFNHVEGAIERLKEGDATGAYHMLTQIQGVLALETMRTLEDDCVGSPAFHDVLEAVTKYHKSMGNGE